LKQTRTGTFVYFTYRDSKIVLELFILTYRQIYFF